MFDENQKNTIVASVIIIMVCQAMQTIVHVCALNDLSAIWNAIYATHR